MPTYLPNGPPYSPKPILALFSNEHDDSTDSSDTNQTTGNHVLNVLNSAGKLAVEEWVSEEIVQSLGD
jgi:hypothetical protein